AWENLVEKATRERGAPQPARSAELTDVAKAQVQIPTQAGHLFRFDRGHPSDLKPATIPI
ncbi:MAG: hypothetical protein RJB09_1672, partial [Pseudomonadota bacterium]